MPDASTMPLRSGWAGSSRTLLAWAERCRGFVIEDDYDAEYRYDGPPAGTLQGLAPERVVYAGSASKILAPALRLGWLCVPPALVESATEVKKFADFGTPYFEQLVYAEFLLSGALDQHLRRMRQVYRRRRDALIDALQRRRAGWTIRGVAAGLHPRSAATRTTCRSSAFRGSIAHEPRRARRSSSTSTSTGSVVSSGRVG